MKQRAVVSSSVGIELGDEVEHRVRERLKADGGSVVEESPVGRTGGKTDGKTGASRAMSVEPRGLSPQRMTVAFLMVAVVVYWAQAALYLDWFVDDAAISFTYARNLAQGHGLVLFPGGERVEAYSNPLWVFLLAFYAFLGMDPFGVAKAFSLMFGALSLFGIARLAQRLTPPGRQGIQLPVGGLAALLTALHPPFVIWTQSGLEGPLYVMLLVWASERFLAELSSEPSAPSIWSWLARHASGNAAMQARWESWGRVPWSGLLFLGAALTRPEGIQYFVAALGLRVMWAFAPASLDVVPGKLVSNSPSFGQRLKSLFSTEDLFRVALFAGPFALYHVWHYAYFASFVTNTWYVKRPEGSLLDRLLNPVSGGWIYVTGWVKYWWLVPGVPLLVLPLVDRPRGGRLRAALLVLGMLAAATFFPLYSDGDWMKFWRFMVSVAPFFMILMAGGLASALSWLPLGEGRKGQPTLGPLMAGAAVLGVAWPAVNGALDYRKAPEVGTADVGTRGAFFKEAREKLGLEGDVVYMDPDLGATSFSSGMRVVDTWGLADVPFAHHGNNQAFPVNYVLEEVRPDFIHVFGYWNSQTHILDDLRWNTYYAPISAYKMRSGVMDGGNYVLRSHLRASPKEYPPTGVLRRFGANLELVHAVFPSGIVAPGQKSELLLFWRVRAPVVEELLFSTRLSGAGLPTINLDHSPLYGWLQPTQWVVGEVVKERLVVDVPAMQMSGQYSLEVGVMATSSGANLEAMNGDASRALPILRVDAVEARKSAAQFSEQARVSLEKNELQQAFELARLATRINPEDPRGQDVLDSAEEGLRDETLSSVEQLMREATPRQAAQTFAPLWPKWRHTEKVVSLGQRFAQVALTRAREASQRAAYKEALSNYLAALTFDPTLSAARQEAESIRMKRDVTTLPPVVGDDARWVRSVVLGVGRDGKLVENRERFTVGESVMCQTFWASGARHLTHWRWYDPQGIQRFEQWQPTAEGAGTSFAFINALPYPGQWTLELWVDNGIVAVRTFEVQTGILAQ